ncbi:hypothetical protein E6O75_ATG11566 [Venturia nashicola]|uniref:Uncharacterized protein n=1 Tax=Venturia nashicola TaxID=86259 RepID=A0A4Z1NP72_9PEZI|nr:hypothetical protein E6O75_ATG11566 [Venturia nashicola]
MGGWTSFSDGTAQVYHGAASRKLLEGLPRLIMWVPVVWSRTVPLFIDSRERESGKKRKESLGRSGPMKVSSSPLRYRLGIKCTPRSGLNWLSNGPCLPATYLVRDLLYRISLIDAGVHQENTVQLGLSEDQSEDQPDDQSEESASALHYPPTHYSHRNGRENHLPNTRSSLLLAGPQWQVSCVLCVTTTCWTQQLPAGHNNSLLDTTPPCWTQHLPAGHNNSLLDTTPPCFIANNPPVFNRTIPPTCIEHCHLKP